MPIAFILVNSEPGYETEILRHLKQISNVKEAYATFGMYDMIAKIEADTMDRLKETVDLQIRKLDKVRSTLTMVAQES